MKKERFKVCCAVYIIIKKDNKILFLKRQNTGYMDGSYALPAGHLDGQETVVQAVIREAEEELGIVVKPQNINLVFTGNQLAPNKEYIDLFFEITAFEGEIKNNEPNKCSELDYMDFELIKENIIPYTKIVLEAISQGKNFMALEVDY